MRIVIVGTGFMGRLHARVVAESDVARLAGIVDIDPTVRARVASDFGTTAFETVEEANASGEVDAFVVAVPDTKHAEAAIPALSFGKPVLLEKPLAHSLECGRFIVEAAHASGSRLMVGHLLRFDPRYAEAARAVHAGEIGEPIHVNATRIASRSVGERLANQSSVLYYLGIHDIDAVQWVCGSPIRNVYSRSNSVLGKEWNAKADDVVVTAFTMENGAVGTITSGWTRCASDPIEIDGRLEVFGSLGSAEVDVRRHGLTLNGNEGVRIPDGLHWPTVNGRIRGDLAAELAHFVYSVKNDGNFLVSEDEALSAVAVNDAIARSLQSNRTEDVRS